MPTRALDVLVLGPYPPPKGGVSTHVQRLCRLLSARGFQVGVLNHFRSSLDSPEVIGTLARNPLQYWWSTRRTGSQVVHYHHARTSTLISVALVARRDPRRFVITLHGHRILWTLGSRVPLVRPVTTWALRQFDEVVAVSREIEAEIRDIVPHGRVTLMPAFLPPDLADAEASGLNEATASFIAGGDPTLVFSAYKVRPLGKAGDLWGLDIAVDAFLTLAASREHARLAVFVAMPPRNRRQESYLDALTQRVHDRGLGDRFLIRLDTPLLGALRPNTVYVRPARTDGDAVSLREALALGVPAIASDVVARPPGVITFPTGDQGALATAIGRVIDEKWCASVTEFDSDRIVDAMLSIYGLSETELDRPPLNTPNYAAEAR